MANDVKEAKRAKEQETFDREGIKKFGLFRTLRAFKYSWEGIKYAYSNEQSLTLHIGATILVVVFGIWLQINYYEWFFIIILIGMVVGIELLNTSIEAVVDLMSPEIHPLAKIAKDTASGAVLALSVTAVIGAALIFVPKILALF